MFVAQDLAGVQPIVAVSGLAGFKPSVQPVLAADKVRHVGEAIAVCVASSRAEAEDLAAAVDVEFDELPPVVDMRAALSSETRLHEHWDNNVFLETFVEVCAERFAQSAPIVVRRRLRTARQCMSPLEGRGVVATWDRRLEQLLVYSSTQMPHGGRFMVSKPIDGKTATHANGGTMGFTMASPEKADAWHKARMANGAQPSKIRPAFAQLDRQPRSIPNRLQEPARRPEGADALIAMQWQLETRDLRWRDGWP